MALTNEMIDHALERAIDSSGHQPTSFHISKCDWARAVLAFNEVIAEGNWVLKLATGLINGAIRKWMGRRGC
jgi:hypothetical protein